MSTLDFSSASLGQRMRELPGCLQTEAGFEQVVAALRAGRPATFDGVWGSSCALLAAELVQHSPVCLVAVFPDPEAADEFCEDLALFTAEPVARYPAWESEPGERIIYDDIYGHRLRTLKRLLAADDTPRLVATSIQSLLQPAPAHQVLAGNTRRLRAGATVDVEELLQWLVAHHFHSTSAVELPGEFSRRGGILDLFAPDWQQPVRVELFGDEVESIRRFDVATQRSLPALEEVELTVLEPGDEARGHLADYLPEKSWFLLVEPGRLQEEAGRYLERVERRQAFHNLPAVMQQVGRFARAGAWQLAPGGEGPTCRLQVESVERFSGDIERVRDELDRAGQGHEVFLVAQTEAESERLAEIFRSTRLAQSGRLHLPQGTLQAGFRLVRDRILLVTGAEIFQRGQLRRTARRRLGKAIDSFLDLQEGDLVVHLAHGIGRYRGMKLLHKAAGGLSRGPAAPEDSPPQRSPDPTFDHVEEHLEIEFHEGTRLYVPASKIDLVQKYVGGSKSRPRLARIGGKTWLRQKQAAEEAVRDMAVEMLELQATRTSRSGIAFSADTQWQQEFEASFPYRETPDQLSAMDAIRGDMERARPMDRLLCGDVGFGKTELAMRAAFKAIDSGHQVAVLVPTTILCEQHYHTFLERMAEFPFDIAKLSRFCTPQEQRETLKALAAGRIDVVIGTHRLASRDVRFHNLGLVIIDEEQRFGVGVKERLKTLRSTVDVLTLSATPIPRTLHMALVGVRDISNLESPPEDRMAVETRVTRFDAELIRHAVLRELNRGGQIFFVHNRVEDIGLVAHKLQHIVPEARLRVGHGQMAEGQLEKVMVDFVNHRFDLLLATTIVESGLDIPNANTIFINEADRYGLADLHQLRGRVGRYKHRAYCYLMVEPHKHVTPNAARRLRAIEEFSDMGAGFALAMRDLEIRGTGNLLGTQQSGHIAAVGYELYCQLLENAVRQLQHLPPQLSCDVELNLPGPAHLPDDYVPDIRLKIDLYRRLTRVTSPAELAEFQAELLDRFGPPPDPVRRMLALTQLRLDAAVWQIASIHLEDRYLVFRYTDQGRIEQLANSSGGRLRVVDQRSAYLPLPPTAADPDALVSLATSVLQSA